MLEFRLMIDMIEDLLAQGQDIITHRVTKLYLDVISFQIL